MSTTPNENATEITLQQALAAHGVGKLEQAQRLYLKVVHTIPGHPQANHNLGVLAMQAGRHVDALAHFQTALHGQPLEAQFWLSYVKALMATDKLDQARQSLALGQSQGLNGAPVDALAAQLGVRLSIPAEQCNAVMALVQGGYLSQAEVLAQGLVQQHPAMLPAWIALSAVLRAQTRYTDALAALHRAQALAPQGLDVLCNIGVVYLDLKEFQEAVGCLEQVVDAAPQFADAHYFLGNAYAGLGRPADAAKRFIQAIDLKPQLLEARYNLATVQNESGQSQAAMATLRQLLQLAPGHTEAKYLLGVLCQADAQWAEAEKHYRQAILENPEFAEPHNNLALLLQRQGNLEDALTHARTAIAINSQDPHFQNALAAILTDLGHNDEAELARNRALEVTLQNIVTLDPENPGGHANLGVFYMANGKLADAITAYEKTIALDPESAHANDILMFAYAYDGSKSPDFYLQQARKWEERVIPAKLREAARRKTFQRSTRKGRPLQVGYVSGDFRNHAVASFVETLFANHDKSRVEITAYSSAETEDDVSRRIAQHCVRWERIAGIDDTVVVEKTDAHAIDILIDLSGYTGLNRMQAFAYRAAPVQAHYLGYFASTGLTEMDYWIADEDIVPSALEAQFSEKVWRLPRAYCCYQGREDAPAVLANRDAADQLCLASFNGITKITDATLALWAQILAALPSAKLLLKHHGFAENLNRRRVELCMASHGIHPDRLDFRGNIKDWNEHMDLYNSVDIALDPVGAHAGVTTTCDALWMGVPVVSRRGDRMAQRQGASILTALGHPEWIADTHEEYVLKVLALAKDTALRTTLRATQRDTMRASALCDARGMAAALEDAYEAMFDLRQAHPRQ